MLSIHASSCHGLTSGCCCHLLPTVSPSTSCLTSQPFDQTSLKKYNRMFVLPSFDEFDAAKQFKLVLTPSICLIGCDCCLAQHTLTAPGCSVVGVSIIRRCNVVSRPFVAFATTSQGVDQYQPAFLKRNDDEPLITQTMVSFVENNVVHYFNPRFAQSTEKRATRMFV